MYLVLPALCIQTLRKIKETGLIDTCIDKQLMSTLSTAEEMSTAESSWET